jgi:predicted DNA repair protein MutK
MTNCGSPDGRAVGAVSKRIIVIARSEATKQSMFARAALDCFAALAMTMRGASI